MGLNVVIMQRSYKILSFFHFCMCVCILLYIRSYGSPPAMVMNVMSAVCVLLKELTDWSSIKLVMADPAYFLKRLAEYDKDRIQDKVRVGCM